MKTNRNLSRLEGKKNKIKVILNWTGVRLALQDLRYLLLPLRKNNDLSGRFRIKYGMTFFNNAASGFTLIELLVVVLIIGILAAVALPQYQKAVEKARPAEIVANVNALTKSAELYLLSGRTDAIYHDDAEVPLTGCVFEEGDDHLDCYTNTARYSFWCSDGTGCGIETNHADGCIVNGAVDPSKCNWTHDWSISRHWDDGQMTVNQCWTQDTDTGRAICKSLEAQGFEYQDGEL